MKKYTSSYERLQVKNQELEDALKQLLKLIKDLAGSGTKLSRKNVGDYLNVVTKAEVLLKEL